jgi:4-hydroxy-3-methylbut-2-enyl diphosphate reductase
VISLKITLADYAGFCGGVKKAVDKATDAAKDGTVYSLGPLAHNESLLRYLDEKGVKTVETLADIPDGVKVLIRTHGAPPGVFQEAERRGLHLIDATCPHVRDLQKLVARLVAEGKQVVIAGDPAHPEVQGLVAWGQGKPLAVSSASQLTEIPLDGHIALVVQTTQRQGIVAEFGEKLKQLNPAVEIYNTICQATTKRQEAACRLAREVDVMVVIGGTQSSNTRKLAEVCRAEGVTTITLTEAHELGKHELQQARTVGVTAGASTPDWTIKEVIAKMEDEKNVEQQDEQMTEEQVDDEQITLDQDVKEFTVGEIVTGTVVQVTEDEALVDIGYKSEGILPRQEVILQHGQNMAEEYREGQQLELVVKKMDAQEGKVILSRKAIERKQKWEELELAFQDGNVLSGRVKESVPAGLVIDLGGGYEGFMPGSLVDTRYVPDFSELLNQELQFKVIELRREKEKVILSRKQVLEDEMASKKEEILNSLQPGQIIHGTVKRLTNFGAFVDVGGIDGLIHISEISWHRIEQPSEVLSVGQEIDVKVIEVIPERERIGLSLRQALPDPWTKVSNSFKPGDIVEGKVTRLVNFGVFVELIPGVEGLVHISQMANYHVKQPSEVVKEGQLVKVKILDINTEAKRVSLSLRDASPRPKKETVPQPVQNNDSGTGLTFGDVFGDLFNEKKGE